MTVAGVFEQNQTAVRRKAAFSGEVERVSEVIEQVYGLVYPLEAVTHDFTERAALVFVTAAHRHDGSEGDAADRSADEGGQRGADRRDCVGNSILLIFVRDSFPVTPVDMPRFPRRQQRSAEAYSTCLTKDEWDRENRPGGDHGTDGATGTVPPALSGLLDMCCTLLRLSAAAGEIGAYQQVSREMNPGRK